MEAMEFLCKNETWDLVEIPSNQNLVRCKWIFKKKETLDPEEPIWFKARLIARGFTQVEGIDYNEIFSPLIRHTSICFILSLTTAHNLKLEQMDEKTIFLHEDLSEVIYMQHLEGFL